VLPETGRWNQLWAAGDHGQVVQFDTGRPRRQYIPTWCTAARRWLGPATSCVPVPDAAAKPAAIVIFQVEVYSGPRPDGFATRTDHQSGQHVPVVLDGTVIGQIAVDDLLP
jgi:hypothetical protein